MAAAEPTQQEAPPPLPDACARPPFPVVGRGAAAGGLEALTESIRGIASSAHIFDAFFTTTPRGSGLGMAIAKRIVEAHGGVIAVGEHTPGAEILVTLPRGRHNEATSRSPDRGGR